MPAYSIGTTATKVYSRTDGYVIDFIVQNLSANNVYFLMNVNDDVTQGLKIVPNASLSKDGWIYDLILIADGGTSDVRVIVQVLKK